MLPQRNIYHTMRNDLHCKTVKSPLGTGGTGHTGQTGHTEDLGVQPQLRNESLPSLELRPSVINGGRCPLETIVFANLRPLCVIRTVWQKHQAYILLAQMVQNPGNSLY